MQPVRAIPPQCFALRELKGPAGCGSRRYGFFASSPTTAAARGKRRVADSAVRPAQTGVGRGRRAGRRPPGVDHSLRHDCSLLNIADLSHACGCAGVVRHPGPPLTVARLVARANSCRGNDTGGMHDRTGDPDHCSGGGSRRMGPRTAPPRLWRSCAECDAFPRPARNPASQRHQGGG